jgi:hypothetical protein
MGFAHPKPVFSVALRGDNWIVEVRWPDGAIEPAAKVKSASAALRWIHESSDTWVANRTAPIPHGTHP